MADGRRPITQTDPLAVRFIDQAPQNPHNHAILQRLPSLQLPDAWLVAGCLFQTVWNLQAGREPTAGIKDYDLFYFDGADFWSRRGLDANGDFYFVLSLKGKTVYNGLTAKKGGRMLFTGAPTLLKPDYTGPIDLIAITFSGNGKDWNHLAFDNFRFRAIAP